jgi:hypothetical protein
LPLASTPMPTQANRGRAARPTSRPPGRPRKNP